ncbi:hypothetical protein [Rhodopirellula halodulae]|uniref:hypothetical protein n=1 Tax=Rhodopirellula halodulae TaxID=2894198 RepID=UPI001E32F430|nr:hypothetical protein [Rhodopirellula sp. JC737]MCC9658231.1 hypothetical protein [Rhodopirellula sp. JC737]
MLTRGITALTAVLCSGVLRAVCAMRKSMNDVVKVWCIVRDMLFSHDVPRRDLWPPISEDEFIRRCSPGVDRQRALRVRRIVSEQLGVDYDRVYPEQRFIEDLGCD